MKCNKAMERISEYIDGALDREKKIALEEHLQNCLKCKGVLEDFHKIKETAGKLEILSPNKAGWNRIQRELIKKQKFSFRLFRPAMAFGTAILIVVVIGALIFGPKIWQNPRGLENRGPLLAMSKLDEAEHHYQQAIKALAEALSAGQKDMDPKILQVFRDNLDIIDASLSACKQAVMNDPGDMDSRGYLLAMYKQKTDLLSQLVLQDTDSAPGSEYKTKI